MIDTDFLSVVRDQSGQKLTDPDRGAAFAAYHLPHYVCRAAAAPAHGKVCHKKSRPRSSPVRSVSPDGRVSTFSVTPPGSPTRLCATTPPPFSIAFEHCPQLFNQGASYTCNSAYFSFLPPPRPMLLVNGIAHFTASETAPLGPFTTEVPAPPAAPTLRRNHGQATTHAHHENRQAIQQFLADLISTLPLTSRPPCIVQDDMPASYSLCSYPADMSLDEFSLLSLCRWCRSRESQVEDAPVAKAPSRILPSSTAPPCPPAPPDCRSVAVQALRGADEDDGYRDSQKDGWVGGVRALRDSHVRLVLRQLRHIERLNRALDRVDRTQPHLS